MGRIRSVHPALWTDEDFVELSPVARLLFIGLQNESDDQGVFEWKPKTIKMRLLPADSVDIDSLLEELEEGGRVLRFAADGRIYGCVRKFCKWQRPKKPVAVHPLPEGARAFVGLVAPEADQTSALRKAKWVEQDGCCFHCGEAISYYTRKATSLELIPRTPACDGVQDDDDDVVAACRSCAKSGDGALDSETPAKTVFAPANELFAPAKVARKNQMEEGGDKMEEKEESKSRASLDAAASPKPKPAQASLLPEPDKPPPTPGQILWTDGLDIYCRLTDSVPAKIRPAFRKLEQIAGGEALMEVLRDCEKNPPRNAYSWIKSACEARAKTAKVRLVIDNDPLDFFGIQAFCRELPGVTPTEHPVDKRNGKWMWRDYVIDRALRNVMEATGLPDSWRGDLSIVTAWIEAGLRPSHDIVPVIKRVVNAGRFDASKPLAYFNPMLAGERGAA